MRGQLRMIVFGVVFVLIGVTLIVEPPGAVAGVGYAVVAVVMIALLIRERRK